MPSMFSRRRGSSASRHSAVPLDQTTRSSAATAAAQAFLAQKPSNGNLSSAAAAAALRSVTSSPEPVGSIQTKRMVRRGSNASIGSNSIMSGRGGPSRGALQRRDSGGSMTERTFRSLSPGSRGNGNGAMSPAPDAPPVPAIPQSMYTRQHQRSSSMEPQQRVISPTPAGRGERASSMDRRIGPPSSAKRGGKRLSNVNEELERNNSNSGVNFSRPRISQPSSPVSPTTDKQYTHGPGNWFSEPVPEASSTQQPANKTALQSKIDRIQAAAGQPVKRDHTVNSAQGTYLHQATQQLVPERPTASRTPSYETADAIMEYDPASRTFISKPRPKPKVAPAPVPAPVQQLPQVPKLAPGSYDPHTRSIVPYPEQKTLAPATTQRASSMTALSQRSRPMVVDTSVAPPPRNPARLSPVSSPSTKGLHKQPSVVHERPDEEETQASPSTGRYITTSAGPVKAYVAPTARQHRSSSLDIPRGSYEGSLRGRGTSTSPSRHTHFSAKPVVQGTIHNPPARDVSPIKSALKHSPASSIRTSSPLANFSPGPRSPSSETSDNTSQASQDAFSGRKKKSVRVSFDEQPQVVETTTAASMRAPLDDSEDEELMKPRPALPTFGSVRNQRNPAIAEKVTETPPERHEASSDHAVGGILRNAQDTTLPVPPKVTSKEGAETVSDDSDSDLGAPLATSTPAQPRVPDSVNDKTESEAPVIRDFAAVPSSKADLDVPAINLMPPTPGAEEEHRTLSPEPSPKQKQSFEINVPGSWGSNGSNEAEVTSAGAAAATVSAVEAQDQGPIIPDDPVIYESPMEHSPLLAPIDESDDDTAEFSDAAEDPSEFENGGFASLDAIAVSPIINASPAMTSTNGTIGTISPPESPTATKALKNAERTDPEDRRSDGDWSQATAYWSKLSRQQREAIEREHLSSDDEARPSVPIARKKKTTAPKPAVPATYEDLESPRAAVKPAPQPAMRKSMRAEPEPEPVAVRPASPEITMRKSMRSSGSVNAGNGTTATRGGGMASTLRNGPPASKQRQAAPQPVGGLANKSMRPTSSDSQASVGLGASAAGVSMVKQRQQQAAPAQDSSYPTLHTKPKTQPAPATNGTPAVSAKLQKELANDSDSESSFKKQRRQRSSASNTNGRYSMAKSMRGGPVSSPAPAREARPVSPEPVRGKGKDSFSIRSLSPTGSFFGRKKRTEEVRQSIRGTPSDSGSRLSMRNPPAQKTMRPQSTQQSKPSTSKFKSRFADSDDDDDDDKPSSSFFKSRFATESDDEDDDVFIPADLRPVRGIPRKQGQTDGDSTDLEDEEDNSRTSSRGRDKMNAPMVPASADIDAAMEIARKKLGITNGPTEPAAGGQGGALQQGSLRGNAAATQPEPKSKPEEVDVTPRKRGWSLLRRNRNSSSSVTQVRPRPTSDVPPVPPVLPSPALAGPIAPAVDAAAEPQTPTPRPQSPTVSLAGKLVRRSSAQQAPRFKRGDSTYSNATAPPAVGESTIGGDWPLPPVPNVPDKFSDRPFTSDGGPQVRFDDSSDIGMNNAAEGRGGVYSARTGKKKKFGLLRKAFGLAD